MQITNKRYSTVPLKAFLTAILFAGVFFANLGVARADALIGKEELASIAALLTKDTCVTECASDDWKVRSVPLPAGYKPPSGSVEQLYLAAGKNSFFCGSRGCISAYVLRIGTHLIKVKEGWDLGHAEKIQANEIFAASASALSVPHLLDNMDAADILDKQVFKNPPQLKLELLSVAAKERDLGIDHRNSLPEDVCYMGVSDALAAQAGKDFVNLALKDLAASIFKTSIDLISTGSPIGDFLLKFGAQMTSSAMTDKPLTEAAILFVTKKSVSYIAGKSTKSYILGKAASSLYEKSFKDLLADEEELIAWKLSGSNQGSESQKGELAPLTNINAEIFYSPYTHYTTAIVGATCNLVKGGTQKNTYIMRYKVIETETKSAKIVDGTLRVFLVPHNTPALPGDVAPLTISQSITSSIPSTPKIGKIIDTRAIGSVYAIGDHLPDGGIVFYIDHASGIHGLVAWPVDDANATWDDAKAKARNHGQGWRLPTKDELNLLYQQKEKGVVGGFSGNFYWSSTEHDEGGAWGQVFNGGDQGFTYDRDVTSVSVRAVRAF